MKRTMVGGVIVLVCLAAGLGAWWKGRPTDAAAAADAREPAPVAQVRSELPRVRTVAETLEAVGDVAAGQATGLSFPRAGQVTALSVVVGDKVAKGATLATLVPDPATRQAYRQAVDAAALAAREWDRQQQLLADHLATQSQADTAAKASLDAQGAVKVLDEQGGGGGTSRLVAPFDAVVTTVSVLQGDRIAAGAPVLQLGRSDALRVLIGIEPADRARVHPGTRVSLWPATGALGAGDKLELSIGEVQNAIDPKTQLIAVVALVPRGLASLLAPGMKVRAELQVGAVLAVAVARNAVLTDEQGDYLFQVVDGRAHRVPVQRRVDNGTLVAVAGIRDMQAPVVVEGNYELQDGMRVRTAAP